MYKFMQDCSLARLKVPANRVECRGGTIAYLQRIQKCCTNKISNPGFVKFVMFGEISSQQERTDAS